MPMSPVSSGFVANHDFLGKNDGPASKDAAAQFRSFFMGEAPPSGSHNPPLKLEPHSDPLPSPSFPSVIPDMVLPDGSHLNLAGPHDFKPDPLPQLNVAGPRDQPSALPRTPTSFPSVIPHMVLPDKSTVTFPPPR